MAGRLRQRYTVIDSYAPRDGYTGDKALSMTSQGLSITDISKTYSSMTALQGVSLEIAHGEMVGLIGASGSGKSTLLRLISGLIAADAGSGQIALDGALIQDQGRISDQIRSIRSRIGFIFQQFNLVERVSLYSNVLMGALGQIPGWRGALGLYPDPWRKAAMDAMDYVGISEHAGKRASFLSGGQQQRGAIARAMVQGAETILADEPIASLDPVSARRVMRLLSDLNRQDGKTVLVSLHQVDYALKYCPRIVALKAGKIVYDGPASDLDRDQLVEIYGDEYGEVMDDQESAS